MTEPSGEPPAKPAHILLIHQAFVALTEPGGTRHYELACALAERGDRVTVIASPVSYLTGAPAPAPASVEETAVGDKLRILRAYTYRALHRSFFHRVLSFLSFMLSSFWIGLHVRQVDLVWGTSPPIFQAASAWLLARLKGVPYLLEVRDLWPAFAVEVGVLKSRPLIRLSEWLESFLYRHADCVMVNSPGFIEHVRSRGARRLELIPNGADPRMFDPQADGSAFRQAHHLGDAFIALYAGAHGMSNDLGVVLDAASLLHDMPDFRIILLGDGKEKSALQGRALDLKLKNLVFLPPVPKTQVPAALAAADACIAILKPIPLYATVYPNKVFDYMAAGRPVLLAIDGVIRQAVEGAHAGVFVPPGDPTALAAAIRRMYADPAGRRQMGNNGREFVEQHFNRSLLAEELGRLVDSLIA